jgi:hypothetical protein
VLFESQPFLQYLLLTNLLLYIALIAGYLRFKRLAASKPCSLPEAFHLLELSLWKTYPDFPEGLTLREALSKVRNLSFEVDWQEMDRLLTQYESYRYGGVVAPTPKLDEIIRLMNVLNRGDKFPRRS